MILHTHAAQKHKGVRALQAEGSDIRRNLVHFQVKSPLGWNPEIFLKSQSEMFEIFVFWRRKIFVSQWQGGVWARPIQIVAIDDAQLAVLRFILHENWDFLHVLFPKSFPRVIYT